MIFLTPYLNYQFGSDKLTKASQKRMDMIVEYLSLDSELELVLIDGYSDSYGGRNTNLKMSERRANKVRDLLLVAVLMRVELKQMVTEKNVMLLLMQPL